MAERVGSCAALPAGGCCGALAGTAGGGGRAACVAASSAALFFLLCLSGGRGGGRRSERGESGTREARSARPSSGSRMFLLLKADERRGSSKATLARALCARGPPAPP